MKSPRLLLMVALGLMAALVLMACARALGQGQPAASAPGFSVVADEERPLDLEVILGVDITALQRPPLASKAWQKSHTSSRSMAQEMSGQPDAALAYGSTSCALLEY